MAKQSARHGWLLEYGIRYYEKKGFYVIFRDDDRLMYPMPDPPSLALVYLPDAQMRRGSHEVWIEAETESKNVINKIGKLGFCHLLYQDFEQALDRVDEVCYCIDDDLLITDLRI
ncbi:MAG: hypothetical protein H5T47_07260 [Archaeoglobi archaeon]|nr:hypothetical protein [Candidatus Mnemosynella bozhongmuii]